MTGRTTGQCLVYSLSACPLERGFGALVRSCDEERRTAGPSAMTNGLGRHRSPLKPKYGLTPISCHAVPESSACAHFIKERRIECINATSLHRKSGQWGTQSLCCRCNFSPNRLRIGRTMNRLLVPATNVGCPIQALFLGLSGTRSTQYRRLPVVSTYCGAGPLTTWTKSSRRSWRAKASLI
jgi:hypothetical protein